ncbi:hypothetical protein [Streptomyces mexicanus]|uniref:hypothetical protein n=1 Tax=Streptomyces mexicanus TaxID=178566 RepID=UPI0036553D36
MTIQITEATGPSPITNNPFYALGAADAYDEYQAGDNVHTLARRADEMLDAAPTGDVPANYYVCGYTNTVRGLLSGHIAMVNAQSEVAQTWLARKQGRETSRLHTANRHPARNQR